MIKSGIIHTQIIGRQIIYLQATMLICILALFFMGGLDTEELEILFPIIGPVTALYLSIAVKLLARESPKFQAVSDLPYEKLHSVIIKIKLLTWGHYIPIILIVLLKALFPNILNFFELTVLLVLLEAFFGFNIGELLYHISELRIKHNYHEK